MKISEFLPSLNPHAKCAVNQFMKFRGDVELDSLTEDDFYAYQNSQKQCPTLSRKCFLLKRWVPNFKNVKPVGIASSLRPSTITKENFIIFYDILRKGNKKVYYWMMALAYSGMRLNELAKLRQSDIDYDNKTIFIRSVNCKTARSRTIPLPERSIIFIKGVFKEEFNKTFEECCGLKGKTVSEVVCRLMKKMGKKFRLHDLRHYMVDKLINKNLNIFEVMTIMGHQSADTTRRYWNVTPEVKKKSRKAMEEL